MLCLLLLLAGCAGGRQVETDDARGEMTIDLREDGMLHNGTAYERYLLEAGRQGVLSLRIARKSGRLDLEVYPAGHRDAPQYRGRELDSCEFDVILTEPGEYRICITADDFVGDYGISWRCEDAARQAVGDEPSHS